MFREDNQLPVVVGPGLSTDNDIGNPVTVKAKAIPSMDEQRKYGRAKAPVAVELSHECLGTILLRSRDISEGGVFVLREPGLELPPIGTILTLEVKGIMGEASMKAEAQVVRSEADGVAIRFLQDLFST